MAVRVTKLRLTKAATDRQKAEAGRGRRYAGQASVAHVTEEGRERAIRRPPAFVGLVPTGGVFGVPFPALARDV